ncbi:MAG: ABC transporter ATP-binding protein [Clostridiales bacterium]|nr:ABC transporter ATP-binding protein [Clostridiales bacterium]
MSNFPGIIRSKTKEWLNCFRNIGILYRKIGKSHKGYIVASLFMILVQAVQPFNSILFLKMIIEELTLGQNWMMATVYAVTMCGLELVFRLLNLSYGNYEAKKIIQLKTDFLLEIEEKTMILPYQQIEDPRMIDERQKAMEVFYPRQAAFMDIQNTIVCFKLLITHILQISGLIAIMLTLNPLIFITLLVICFISSILNAIASNKEFEVWDQSLVKIGRKLGYFQEISTNFTYAKEMRINRLGQWIVDKMQSITKAIVKGINKTVVVFTVTAVLSSILMILQNGGMYLYLGWLAYSQIITIADLTAYISSIGTFIAALTGVSGCLITLQKSGLYIDIYLRYLKNTDFHIAEEESPTVGLNGLEDFELHLENVWFSYPDQEEYTLKGVTLTISNHMKLAIVGENGAGKTTLIKLLLRLYKPTKGYIYLNGVDIQTINFQSYIQHIAAVFQDFRILNFTADENIRFGRQGDEGEIEEIIREIGLTETFSQLPAGLETVMGRQFNSDGTELSGGQQQKLAIARALYKQASLIVLDEPTAMLSPRSEYEIYTNFYTLTKDKTTIYISHRMSSCRFCDQIVVLNSGEMIEKGSHEELIKAKGEYYRLYTLQAEFYQDLKDTETHAAAD